MTVSFASLLGILWIERVDVRIGRRLFVPLVLGGVATLLYAQRTGDLRFYGWLQAFSMLALPAPLVFFPARYTKAGFFWGMAGAYALAKLGELFDRPVHDALGGLLSGHTLKHAFAALATAFLVSMLAAREPIG